MLAMCACKGNVGPPVEMQLPPFISAFVSASADATTDFSTDPDVLEL